MWHEWGEEERIEVTGRKAKGKEPLGRRKRRWINNIKLEILERELDDVDWISLAHSMYKWKTLVDTIMNFEFHKMLGNFRVSAQLVVCQVALSTI
jgi:hypothetical protein